MLTLSFLLTSAGYSVLQYAHIVNQQLVATSHPRTGLVYLILCNAYMLSYHGMTVPTEARMLKTDASNTFIKAS